MRGRLRSLARARLPQVMFQGHKDKCPHMFRVNWLISTSICTYQTALMSGQDWYDALAPVWLTLYYCLIMFGIPISGLTLSQKAKSEDVQGGTAGILSIGSLFLASMALIVAMQPELGALMKSAVLMIISAMTLMVIKPEAKRAYGANWCVRAALKFVQCLGALKRPLVTSRPGRAASYRFFTTPGIMLALETGNAAIFLSSPLNDPQLYLALGFQLGYSFIKNTGIKMDLMEKIKTRMGIPTPPEQLPAMRTDLAIIATAHNFGEIVSVVYLMFCLIAEAVCRGMGLTEHNSDISGVIDHKYLKTGIIEGWRGDVPASETFIVLLVILVARIGATYLEESYGSRRFGPRRKHIKRLVELALRDGPWNYRVMMWGTTLCLLFIMPPRLALYAQQIRAISKLGDDDATE